MSVPLPNIKPEVAPRIPPPKQPRKEIQFSEAEAVDEDSQEEDKDQGTDKRFRGGLGWVRPTPKGFTVRQGCEPRHFKQLSLKV